MGILTGTLGPKYTLPCQWLKTTQFPLLNKDPSLLQIQWSSSLPVDYLVWRLRLETNSVSRCLGTVLKGSNPLPLPGSEPYVCWLWRSQQHRMHSAPLNEYTMFCREGNLILKVIKKLTLFYQVRDFWVLGYIVRHKWISWAEICYHNSAANEFLHQKWCNFRS